MTKRTRWWIWSLSVLFGVVALGVWVLAPPQKATGLSAANSRAAPALGQSPPRPLRVLVIGGTSGIGLETTRLALARGHQVIVMSRRGRIEPALTPAPTIVPGDVRDASAVARAMHDVDAVVLTVSAPLGRDLVTVFSDGVRNVLSARPARLLFVSGIGAGDSRGHGGFGYDRVMQPLMLAENYADKDRAEALLHASAVDWTIVRPGFLTDEPASGQYRIVADLNAVRSGALSRADVAHYLIAAIEGRLDSRRTVLLTN